VDYVLCATPRTGSNLLKSGLGRTGLAGAPEEVFDPPKLVERGFEASACIDVKAYLERTRAELTGRNGVFGIKLHFHHLEALFFERGIDLAESLDAPRFIHISRDDRLGQAISWMRAAQTGQFTWEQSARDDVAPQYDFFRLGSTFLETMRHQAGWEDFFRRQGIEPLRVRYEELVEDYRRSILRVLDFLEVDIPMDLEVPPPSLRKQADALNDRWRQRFLQDMCAILDGRIEAPSQEARAAATRLAASVARSWVDHHQRMGRTHEVEAVSRLLVS